MPATVEVKCKCCKTTFTARVADRKRGWAQFCSKSCKAIHQDVRSGRQRGRNFRREFGGNPQFNERGDYVGFTLTPGEE